MSLWEQRPRTTDYHNFRFSTGRFGRPSYRSCFLLLASECWRISFACSMHCRVPGLVWQRPHTPWASCPQAIFSCLASIFRYSLAPPGVPETATRQANMYHTFLQLQIIFTCFIHGLALARFVPSRPVLAPFPYIPIHVHIVSHS